MRLLAGSKYRDIRRAKCRTQTKGIPLFQSGHMIDLEPGEMPFEKYVPPLNSINLSSTGGSLDIRSCEPTIRNAQFYQS